MVKNKLTNDTIPVPCGKCPPCLKRRASGWSFRIMQHYKTASSAHMVTLTYDNAHIPITKNGFRTLQYTDVQLFFKRLRKVNPEKLKYYVAGEYGTQTRRPHYHIVLFNAILSTIQPAWMLGSVHYCPLNEATVGYTLKYMCKPPQFRIPQHRNDDRLPERSLISKGLGGNYLSPQMITWHKADLDNRMYCNIEDGKKIAMPRYYKDKIYTEWERKRVAFFALQKKVAAQLKAIADCTHPNGYNFAKAEADAASFRKFYKSALTGRNSI